jgi:hypothetical protein
VGVVGALITQKSPRAPRAEPCAVSVLALLDTTGPRALSRAPRPSASRLPVGATPEAKVLIGGLRGLLRAFRVVTSWTPHHLRPLSTRVSEA